MDMRRETATAIMDAVEKERGAVVTVTEIATMTVTVIATTTAIATEAVTEIMRETVIGMMTATEAVTETAAITEVRNQDHLLLLQIPADVKKSLFHNRLF